MSHSLPSPLPLLDRILLLTLGKAVPAAEREEWFHTWQAELWHIHHRTRSRRSEALGVMVDLSIGLLRDALWLRTDSWRRALSGTAILCLSSLFALCLLSALASLVLNGGWHALSLNLGSPFKRFVIETPLVAFVTFATASRRHVKPSATGKTMYWIKRQLFFAAKATLVLVLSFLLSTDVCQPLHASLPVTADLVQVLISVCISLVGLRWAFHDQGQRCNQCLRVLSTPARVGRPSHNLLEWNGNELVCRQGHGLLSIPEMETSWCRSSEWITQNPGWDRVAGVS